MADKTEYVVVVTDKDGNAIELRFDTADAARKAVKLVRRTSSEQELDTWPDLR